MPTFQEHREQVNHNEDTFPKMLDPSINAPGWAITIMFYTILHYFEAYLADTLGSHLDNHQTRNRHFRRFFPMLWMNYERLYNASKNARYEVRCLGPNTGDYFERLRTDHFLPLKTHFESI